MPKPEPVPIKITPEMRDIMQTLADNLNASRNTTTALQSRFDAYTIQCALLLGLNPSDVTFDPPSASFIFKPSVGLD
jgi:hypothetical protein